MFDDTNRPKIGIAVVITIIALVVWGVSASSPSDEDADPAIETVPVATAINGVPLEPAAIEGQATAIEVATTADEPARPRVESPDEIPAFMDGDVPSTTAGASIPDIAVPEAPAVAPIRLSASYRSTIVGFRTCLVEGLTTGLTVTVTNLSNGRSVTCVTALAPADQIDQVVMHTRSFQEIADLTESPIKVEITR